MQLDYFREENRDGYRIQYARPNETFWIAYRKNAQKLGDLGFSVTWERDSRGVKEYTVARVTKIGQDNLPEPVPVSPYVLRDTEKLLDYQVKPVAGLIASLMSHGVAIDASDTGTGKTYTALKTCAVMGLQPAIICTKTGIYQWRKACKFFGINPLFVYNWESCIGRVRREGNYIVETYQPPNPYVEMAIHPYRGTSEFRWKIAPNSNMVFIFDEAHKANGDGSSSQKIMRAAFMSQNKIMPLSATLADKLAKFKMIGSLIGLFEYDKFDEWLKAVGCFENQYNQWEATNEKEMMLKISKYIFPSYGVRVRKDDLPNFPKCQNIARLYNIDKAHLQNKAFEKAEKQIRELQIKASQAGEKNTEFKQLAIRMRYRQMAETYKIPLLIDLAKEYVEAGHSVIIFTCFVPTLETLAKKLKTDCVIKGGQSASERRAVIEKFGNDKERICITNMQAGGTAVDGLQDKNGTYSRVGLIAPIDDAVILKQTLGRIHRSNSATKSMNILVYSAGTVEEKVFKNVHNKLHNIDLLNDGDMAESATFKKE